MVTDKKQILKSAFEITRWTIIQEKPVILTTEEIKSRNHCKKKEWVAKDDVVTIVAQAIEEYEIQRTK